METSEQPILSLGLEKLVITCEVECVGPENYHFASESKFKLFTSPVNLGLLRGEEGALERTLRKKESFEACEPKNPSGTFQT